MANKSIVNRGEKNTIKLTFAQLRMLLCFMLGAWMIYTGLNSWQMADLITMSYAPFFSAMGVFVVMFAFRPSLGKDIIKAITSMLKRRH